MSDDETFSNRIDRLTKLSCERLNIPEERSNQVRAIVEHVLVQRVAEKVIKDDDGVILEATTAEVLAMVRRERDNGQFVEE